MPAICHFTKKRTTFGNRVCRSGAAVKEGGFGLKTSGISRRTFKPNLQRIHVWLPNGTTRYVKVATSVIRSGELTLDVDGEMRTFPLIKVAKGSRQAREERKSLYPI